MPNRCVHRLFGSTHRKIAAFAMPVPCRMNLSAAIVAESESQPAAALDHMCAAFRVEEMHIRTTPPTDFVWSPPPSVWVQLVSVSLLPPLLVQDAQNALRRIMETHSNVTRFCFICNYVSRIIEPLASRCAKFRFKPLHEGIMENRVNSICRAEGVELAPGSMAMLGQVSHGDLRRAITTLQSAYSLTGNPVKEDTLIDVSGEVRL